MIETNYPYESGYHDGTLVEQDALAFLGVFKRIEEVPARYNLHNHESNVNAEAAWEDYDARELQGLSAHTRRYVYGKAYREWVEYCGAHEVHPALATPQDIEAHLSTQKAKMDKLKTVYDSRFRPLFRWYRWMQFHTEYPHRYNPIVMAVLLDGAVYDVWQTRLNDRTNVPQREVY